jgi:hypothetical protein
MTNTTVRAAAEGMSSITRCAALAGFVTIAATGVADALPCLPVTPAETPSKFKLGQCVSHQDQPLPSLVLSRVKTQNAKGKVFEIYGVRSFATVDPHRDRLILGDALVSVVPGTRPCQDCLLHNTGMCPNRPAAV